MEYPLTLALPWAAEAHQLALLLADLAQMCLEARGPHRDSPH